MLIGDALVNTLAFAGSSYLFHRLSVNSIDTKRARHDVVIEQLQRAQIGGNVSDNNELISLINNSG